MKRFFVNKQLNINENFVIDGIEHNHIKNVMRMQVGDEIILVCGDEFDYNADRKFNCAVCAVIMIMALVIMWQLISKKYNRKNKICCFWI